MHPYQLLIAALGFGMVAYKAPIHRDTLTSNRSILSRVLRTAIGTSTFADPTGHAFVNIAGHGDLRDTTNRLVHVGEFAWVHVTKALVPEEPCCCSTDMMDIHGDVVRCIKLIHRLCHICDNSRSCCLGIKEYAPHNARNLDIRVGADAMELGIASSSDMVGVHCVCVEV
jgi:hypothetical protein